jgi:hypothetical protein
MYSPGVNISVYHRDSAPGCATFPLLYPPSTAMSDISVIPMSLASNASFTSSNFEAIFNAALTEYTKQTGKDLRDHPFASEIDSCDNPDSIIAIFQEQARAFDEFRKGDIKLFKWFKPVIKVLHALSNNKTLSDIASNVSPATLVIFSS